MRFLKENTFQFVNRTMDGFSFTDPSFLITVLLGAIFFCAISFLFTYFESKDGNFHVNSKALLRDSILGAIFTSMAWNIIPESMKSFGDGITGGFTSLSKSSVMKGGSSSVTPSSSSDFDLQVGPASF